MRIRTVLTTVPVVALTIAACCAAAAPAAPAGAQNVKPPSSIADAKRMLTPRLPSDALEISAASSSVKVNQIITLHGYIPHADGFSPNVAEFWLHETLVPPGAPAPARARIRILDADGKPLAGSLDGALMLKPGTEVFVSGKVETPANPGAATPDGLVLSARSMHVPPAPLPLGFFLDKLPDNARDVSEARKAGLKIGDEVVLTGRIGGSADPFVAGRAVFTMVGRGLKACNEIPGDKCKKPWDYCCDTRDEILANSVSVQVVNAKWETLRTDIKGRRGIKELSEVTVVGKVIQADGKSVVVNAANIYAAPATNAPTTPK